MNQMIRWLETKLSRREAAADEMSNPESAEPDEIDLETDRPKDLQEPAENVPMPDVNDDEYTITSPNLEFTEDTDKTTGFDPYDTAKMHKK
jgi:hypothetical protein